MAKATNLLGNIKMMDTSKTISDPHIWFAFGYYDGRQFGYENTRPNNDIQKLYYRLGYDRGVSDYCDELEEY